MASSTPAVVRQASAIMRGLVLFIVLSLGCQEQPHDQPTSSARPPPSAPPAPTVSASATANPGWPGAETSLKQLLSAASLVKVSEIAHDGTRVELHSGILKDPKDIEALLMALGQDQVPMPGCVRCMPSVTLNFEDGRGTRLGAIGLFCDEGTAATTATLRDGAGNNCHLLKLSDSATTRFLIRRSAALAASAAAFPAATIRAH